MVRVVNALDIIIIIIIINNNNNNMVLWLQDQTLILGIVSVLVAISDWITLGLSTGFPI